MQAEGRRFGDQYHEVGAAHRLDDRTRGARRRIDQHDLCTARLGSGHGGADRRHSLGFAHGEPAGDQGELVAPLEGHRAVLDLARRAPVLADGALGAEQRAGAAGVAELREQKDR